MARLQVSETKFVFEPAVDGLDSTDGFLGKNQGLFIDVSRSSRTVFMASFMPTVVRLDNICRWPLLTMGLMVAGGKSIHQ